MANNPRRFLGHARKMPMIENAKEASDATVPVQPPEQHAPQQPVAAQPAVAPAQVPAAVTPTIPATPAAATPVAAAPQPQPEEAGEGGSRVSVRKRDNKKMVRKNVRIGEAVAAELEFYCREERWPEGTIIERALEMYLRHEMPDIEERMGEGK